MPDLERLQTWYWLSFFIVIIAWGTISIGLRKLMRGSPLRRGLSAVQGVAGACLTVAFGFAPLVLKIPLWKVGLALLGPALAFRFAPRLITPDGSRARHQLQNVLSWFGLAWVMTALAFMTGRDLWWMGAAILLAASVWNAYSEFALKPMMQEFYSDIDEDILWSAFVLPEEYPTIVMCSLSLLLAAGVFEGLSPETMSRFFQTCVVPVTIVATGAALAALMTSFLLPDDLKRSAASRAFLGVAGLLGLVITLGSTASVGDHTHLPVASSSLLDSGIIPGPVPAMAIWVAVAALAAGAIALVPILLNTLTRRPEYDLFISFASPDLPTARAVAAGAGARGIRYFFSDQTLAAGDPFRNRIRKAIRNASEMAVLCTPASIASRWVRDEVSIAVGLQKRVTPILHGGEPRDLNELLPESQQLPLQQLDVFLNQVRERTRRWVHHTIAHEAAHER